MSGGEAWGGYHRLGQVYHRLTIFPCKKAHKIMCAFCFLLENPLCTTCSVAPLLLLIPSTPKADELFAVDQLSKTYGNPYSSFYSQT